MSIRLGVIDLAKDHDNYYSSKYSIQSETHKKKERKKKQEKKNQRYDHF
jgi:hypothetical protein